MMLAITTMFALLLILRKPLSAAVAIPLVLSMLT